MASLRVALGEYDTGWHDTGTSIERAGELIRRARAAGADLVVLPEMCTTGFTMKPAHYSEVSGGPAARKLSGLARESSVHVVAGIATREPDGTGERFYNSSFLFDPRGEIVAEYRKQRLFAYASEDAVYTPGTRNVIVTIGSLRIALFICFELRFPELFREVAPSVDAIVVIANWPSTRHAHWQTLLRARAIESQAFVIGVNRIGTGGDLQYLGGSIIHGPWGETLAAAGGDDSAVAELDPSVIRQARRQFPFVVDQVSL